MVAVDFKKAFDSVEHDMLEPRTDNQVIDVPEERAHTKYAPFMLKTEVRHCVPTVERREKVCTQNAPGIHPECIWNAPGLHPECAQTVASMQAKCAEAPARMGSEGSLGCSRRGLCS